MGNSKNTQSSATPTLISKGCFVTGKIESDVFVRIDGHIKGDLFIGEGLIVGEDGLIDGNISTRDIVVYGTVNGTVKAESIEIKSSGKIFGEIQTKALQVERGAVYTGMISMSEEATVEKLVAVR